MNKQELIEKYKRLEGVWDAEGAEIARRIFLQDLEQLDEPEKPIRLKDVIKRIKGFDEGTKFNWTYDILKELGSDFGSKMFHEAYQQGRFDEGMDAYYGREKVTIPQFVADYIEWTKEEDYHLLGAMGTITTSRRKNLYEWFYDDDNMELFARAWLDGYEVEKEKRYYVRLKIDDKNYNYLNYIKHLSAWCLAGIKKDKKFRTEHTRKQLEDAGFGEVFNSTLFEVEEVE